MKTSSAKSSNATATLEYEPDQMRNVTAEDAGKALGIIGAKLEDAGILTAEGRSALSEESNRLRKAKKATKWQLEVVRGRPISFERARDKNGHDIQISLICDIAVFQKHDDHPPFESLDIAIEMHGPGGKPVGRWHVDRANVNQGGPLYHLQFGGHVPGFRAEDFSVKEPRWCHPPMEIALLCEVISANFFEPLWRKYLREDPSWCASIQLFQRLCYHAYAKMLNNCVGVSRSTALAQMWNDEWTLDKKMKAKGT